MQLRWVDTLRGLSVVGYRGTIVVGTHNERWGDENPKNDRNSPIQVCCGKLGGYGQNRPEEATKEDIRVIGRTLFWTHQKDLDAPKTLHLSVSPP